MGFERPRDASDLLPPRTQGGASRRDAVRRRSAAHRVGAVGRHLAGARRRHRYRAGQHGRAARSSTPGWRTETFIDHATTGFEEFRAAVEPWTLEEGERVTGVPAETIRELAHAYARADRAILCWTLGITEHVNAVDNVLSLINLSLLTGHVGRYGSGLNPLRGQNNVQGGGDMGAIPNKLPGFQDVEDDMTPAPGSKRRWGVTLPPEARLAPHADVRGDGARRATTLYVMGENPAQSEADSKKALELLEGLDFLIVQDILMTRTCELADVVLPGLGLVVRGRGRHGDQQRAARAAHAKGARPAGPGPRRSLDPDRARPAARPRLGPSDARAGLGRVAVAQPDARAV